MGEVCELAAHGASLGDVEAQRADANGVEEDALPVADADCEHGLREDPQLGRDVEQP